MFLVLTAVASVATELILVGTQHHHQIPYGPTYVVHIHKKQNNNNELSVKHSCSNEGERVPSN